MITLVIDSSNQYSYLGFFDGSKIICEKYRLGNNDHSEKQVDFLEECLNEFDLNIDDISSVLVGVGPGSYTGLRAAMTLGKVLALVKELPIAIVSSLDLLLSGQMKNDGKYIATLKAKKGSSYAKTMIVENGNIILSDEIFIDDIDISNKYPEYQIIIPIVSVYNIDFLYQNNLVKPQNELHQLVPNYLRSGIWDVH